MSILLRTPLSTSGTANPITLNYTCTAGDNCLIVLLGTDEAVAGGAPTAFTYNGVALSQAALHTDVAGGVLKTAMIYYLFNPPTSSLLLISATDTNTSTGEGMIAVSGSGFDTTRAPVAGTGADANTGTTAACSAAGAGVSDLYFGITLARSAAIANNGGVNQNNLAALTNINTLDSVSADWISGANAGNFSWTITSGVWTAIAAKFFAAATGGSAMTGPVATGVAHPIDQSVTGLPI